MPTRVVIAEDEAIIRLDLKETLEEEGYEVVLHSYASRDLDEVKALRPDLIVLDFIIGGEDHGWQLLQKLKLDRHQFDGTRQLAGVAALNRLQILTVDGGELTSEDIQEIAKLHDLHELQFSLVSVTGESLQPLGELKHLETFDLKPRAPAEIRGKFRQNPHKGDQKEHTAAEGQDLARKLRYSGESDSRKGRRNGDESE